MQPPHHHPSPQSVPRNLRPHKTHLSLDYTDDAESLMSSFAKNLKIMKKHGIPSGIKSLTIGSNKNSFLTSMFVREDFRKVSLHLLKEFRSLKSLKITCARIEDIPALRKTFKRFRGLESLDIVFDRGTIKTDRACPGDFIQRLSPRLNQLKLSFANPPFFGNEREDSRCHLKNCQIDRLNGLQKLAIHLPIPKVLQEKKTPKENFTYVDLTPLKNLNKLQSLDVVLTQKHREELVEINTEKLQFDPNKLFPNLKRFTWKVVHKKELEKIGGQIASQLKHLDDFGLGLQGDVKVGVQELSLCLAALQTDLNSFHFEYNCEQISKDDAKALIYELSSKRLNKLHTLSLEFPCCKGITNGFLGDLAKVFATNFTGLRSLRLSLDSSEQEDGKVLSYLKGVFGNERVSNTGIKDFASILSKECQELEFVSLKFKKHAEITDSGVKSLCQGLNKLKKLKTVWIMFEECSGVTENGCEKAAEILLGANRHVLVSNGKNNKLHIGM